MGQFKHETKLFFLLSLYRDPRFRAFRIFGDYREALLKGRGKETLRHMSIAYKHVNDWIGEKVTESRQDDDPEKIVARNATSVNEVNRLLKRGQAVPGQGKKKTGGDIVVEHLDLGIVHRLLSTYLASEWRRETLKRFGEGNFTSPNLGINDLETAGVFLALELYLTNAGVRMDLVHNMTLGELKNAKHALDRCPYCRQPVMYSDHKKACLERPRRGEEEETGYDSGSEASKRVGRRWRIPIKSHKTSSSYGTKELNVAIELLRTVHSFSRVSCLTNNGPDVQPFNEKDCSWQRMRTLLGRIVRQVDADLWRVANPPNQQLGLNAFRRLHLYKVDKTADPKQKEALLRGAGTSSKMLNRTYKSHQEESCLRSETCEELAGGSAAASASPSGNTNPEPPPVPASRAAKRN